MDRATKEYVETTPLSYRKEHGQFFTPRMVADLMTEWVLQNSPNHILDPAYGLGAFATAIMRKHPTGKCLLTGVELDHAILRFNKDHFSQVNLEQGNYLEWEPSKKPDAIICNPPYLRFQNHKGRHNVLQTLEKKLNVCLSGYTNIASLFLLKSIHEIAPHGAMSYIMPYEFFNTRYGKIIKNRLIADGILKQIIIFENEKDIFEDATTTITVLLMKKDHIVNKIKITKIDSLSDLLSLKSFSDSVDYEIPNEIFHPEKKWTSIINSFYEPTKPPSSFVPIKTFGSFSRGIATGANKFFSLNKATIRQSNINRKNIAKCITKSAQIKNFVLDDKLFRNLVNQNHPVFCLNVTNHQDNPTKRYMRKGKLEKIHLRYLTQHRTPWYRLEKRSPAPILAGVFNRGRLKFVRNLTSAINFTCFHSFYPNDHGRKLINQIYLYLISDHGQRVLRLNKRDYGSGLKKFEPSDLNEALIPHPSALGAISDKTALGIIKKLNSTPAPLDKINRLFDGLGASAQENEPGAAFFLT